MMQISSKLDLAEKSFPADGVPAFTVKDLQRNTTAMLHILRGVNGGHPTSAEDPLDSVALGE
jgi:hypothetical protein